MRTRSLVVASLAALLLAGCGSQDAVESGASLDDLGARMADPASTLAGMIRESGGNGRDRVADDATKNRACPGGHRRVFRSTVTLDTAVNDDEATVRNRVSLLAQATLKEAGAKVTTDLGQDGSTVPAALDFANEPSEDAQKRSYRTTVKVGADSYTWKITGRTACIAD